MTIGDDGVVVIGAGVAGLAAAIRLRAAGVRVTLVEAAPQPGGRARTALLAGAPFDLGATWLHAAGRNPLVPLALAEDQLRNTDQGRTERVSIGGRPATVAEQDAYAACWNRLDAAVAPALASAGPDTSLRAAMAPLYANPGTAAWADTVAQWEGAIIAAADADELSLRDWHRNALEGPNLQPAAGVGAFLARRLATEVICDAAVTAIEWDGPGVRVETTTGTLRGAAVVVTVSTGVLASGSIRFRPALPALLADAIDRLPMGLLTKIGLACPRPTAFAPDSLLLDRAQPITFDAWPGDRGYVTGFVGGRLAWSLASDGPAAAELARAALRDMAGLRTEGEVLLSAWATDPLHRGAYAFARPGDSAARDTLADAFPAARLLFAGEATATDGLAGTVGGAYLTGLRAADRLLAS